MPQSDNLSKIAEAITADLAGNASTTTQSPGDDSTKIATTAYADAAGVKPTYSWLEQIGSSLNLSSASVHSISAMNKNEIALLESNSSQLRYMEWDGNVFAQVGSAVTVSEGVVGRLTSTDVVAYNSGTEELITFRWGGASWSQVGNRLDVGYMEDDRMCAMGSNACAISNTWTNRLEHYSFDGTDWTSDGYLTITLYNAALIALNATDIAVVGGSSDWIRTYRWTGSAWEQIGNTFSINISGTDVTALNSTDIVTVSNQTINTFRFDGTDWTKIGVDNYLTGTGSKVTALNGIDIAFIDSTSDDLSVYRFDFSVGSGPSTE